VTICQFTYILMTMCHGLKLEFLMEDNLRYIIAYVKKIKKSIQR